MKRLIGYEDRDKDIRDALKGLKCMCIVDDSRTEK